MLRFLIALERLPASSLGCYGSWQFSTPFVDELAAHSLLVECLLDVAEAPLKLAWEAWQQSVACSASPPEFIHFDPAELLQEVVAEDWQAEAATWLSAADAAAIEFEDTLDLLEAFLWDAESSASLPLSLRLALHGVLIRSQDRLALNLRAELTPELQTGDQLLWLGLSGEPLVEREAAEVLQPAIRPELQHLPLLIETIGQDRGQRLSAPISPDDVSHLVQQLLAGGSLRDWQQAVSSRPQLVLQNSELSVVQTRDWCLVQPVGHSVGASEHPCGLYRLPEDPWCLLNVATQYPQIVEQLASCLPKA